MNIGVIFAGGQGTRMHSKEKPKQFLDIQGKPIIVHTINHFQDNCLIDAIVVVCISEWIHYLEELILQFNLSKVAKIVPGGRTGQQSIYNGLIAAKELAGDETTIVVLHDGVRPLISRDTITENINTVRKYGNCITGASVVETITETEMDGSIKSVLCRERTRIARAPQSFWLADILAAHEKAIVEGKTEFIDSCSLMQYYGNKMHMIDGPNENIKITTPNDYYFLRAILQMKEDAQLYGLA